MKYYIMPIILIMVSITMITALTIRFNNVNTQIEENARQSWDNYIKYRNENFINCEEVGLRVNNGLYATTQKIYKCDGDKILIE